MSEASTAVDKAAPAGVPALTHQAPPLEIGGDDIALPRLYIGQFLSQAVTDGVVKAGDIYGATSPDDEDAEPLWSYGDDKDKGPVFHVLGMTKGLSWKDGDDLQRGRIGDPAAPDDAWVTYNYVICLPEIDGDVPYKFLLTKTGRPAAKQINLVLSKTAAAGPPWEQAFRLTCDKRENQKGVFFVAKISHIEADKKNVEVAESLAHMVSGNADEYNATGEEPAI